jgi:hypothetical protein
MTQTGRRRTSRDADRRADARRRSRHASDDAAPAPEDSEPSPDADGGSTQPNLLRRLFIPPAAPLADKPDPLAGFSYAGPEWLRVPASGVYLLRANPVIWLVAGLVWAIARLFESATIIGFVASMVEFAALIGAGYLGWQRPWLYGLASAITGLVILLAYAIYQLGSTGAAFDVSFVGIFLLYFGLPTALLGALAGWFGGYWRRRLAEARTLRNRGRPGRR